MFEKQFDLAEWVQELDSALTGTDFLGAIEEFAAYLSDAGGAYREATSAAERKRELAFMMYLTARLHQHLAIKLVGDTPD